MVEWSDGYITSIEYTSGFYPGLSPLEQNFALLYRGHAPVPLSEKFAYCELGCGHGFSTALLAAANPNGTFWGIDFNPTHIAGAEQFAREAGLANVTFVEHSFAEAARSDLPKFNFIALHGVWSWISRGNRGAVLDFINAKLKPGGVVYISYNAMPGWAAKAPLRQLLAERHRGQGQPTPAAIDEALAFARRMRDAGAAYFQVSPLIGMHLESIAGMSRNYLAHEYFNRDWSPSYHAEVASDLAAAKLTFAAPSALAEQIDHLSLGDKAQELLQEVADPAARETLRDYFVNRQFRRDIFVRGGRQLSAREREERLLATRVALVTPVLPAKVRFPLGEVTLDPQTYGPIADSLAERPRPLAELLAQPRVVAVGPNAAFQAAVVLIASGHVAPALDAEGEEGRQASVARFNKAVLARVANGGGESTLASPVLGTGLPVPPVDRLFLAAEAANLPQPVEWLLKTMTARSQQILKEGRPVASGDEARAELQLSHTEFRKYRMPFYQGMGVLIRPPSS